MIDLNGLATVPPTNLYYDTEPAGINNAGQVTGYSYAGPSPGGGAFLYSSSNGMTTMTNLRTLPGGLISASRAINNSGEVVGVSDPYPGYHAFLYNPTNGMRDLNDSLPGNTDLVLYETIDINDFGQIIALGVDSTGGSHPVLLSPASNVTDNLFSSVQVTFNGVYAKGITSSTSIPCSPPLPAGFQVDGACYDISTTSVFVPPATVCISGSFTTSPPPKLFHYENGAWLDVTNPTLSSLSQICGQVNSLSPFAIAHPVTGITTPTITWVAPSSITYGTALSGTQLNATASVPGAFSYSPAAGTVLSAGVQTLNVTFTPTDTTNYTTASASVSITVNQAQLTVTAQNASKVYGAGVPSLTYSITGS